MRTRIFEEAWQRLALRIIFGLCLFLPLAGAGLRAETASRPNILFFLTDDESWFERSAYGWSKLPTPAFDRVARDGVLFTNGYTSAPSCAPSRASVLTGRNFWELRQGAFIQAYLPDEYPLVTHLLENAGYHVGGTGKGWGPGVYIEGSHAEETMLGQTYNDIQVARPIPDISPIDYVANFVQFLGERKRGQPFFFWVGTHEPHGPFDAENYKRLESEFGMTLDDVSLPPFVEDTRAARIRRANKLYEICYADRDLAQVLTVLEERGELQNTLVIVTSDNGTAVTLNGYLHGKASAYDSGVHVPLAAMWPGKMRPGRTVTDFVNFRDFAPTFLELAGADAPEGMTGKSIVPILLSEKSGRIDRTRNWMMTGLEWHGEFDPETRSSRSIRNDRYAYIEFFPNVDDQGRPLSDEEMMRPYRREFYDLERDPWQEENLIGDARLGAEIQDLEKQMHAYATATGDPRYAGGLEIFRQTRAYVQKRKCLGYEETLQLPFARTGGDGKDR